MSSGHDRVPPECAADCDVEYMWVKKFLPKAPELVRLVVTKRIAPGEPAQLNTLIPPGQFVPVLYSATHGVWQGAPFKIE